MKLLKQLVQVLDERGIQVKKLNIGEDTINGEYSIEINKEIMIVDRGGNYALYTEDASLDKTYYISLTEALEKVADYLSRVKEGSIVQSTFGVYKYKIVKHDSKDLYNLLDLSNNRLLYTECKSKSYIQEWVNTGHLHAE